MSHDKTTGARRDGFCGGCRTGEGRKLARLASLAAVLLIALGTMAPSCSNWELTAYRTLATAQVTYENTYTAIVVLHRQGAITDAQLARSRAVADRIYALGRSATGLLVSYKTVADAPTRARINAALAELPKLVLELEALITSFRQSPPGGAGYQPALFAPKVDAQLGGIEQRLDVFCSAGFQPACQRNTQPTMSETKRVGALAHRALASGAPAASRRTAWAK